MPIVEAFKGYVTVEGHSRETPEELLYSKTVTAYGESIGELLDNLVLASVTIANDAFQWAVLNKPENYTPLDDRWFISFVHPEILPRKDRDRTDVGNGSNLITFDAIVMHCALFRDVTINMEAAHLRLAKSGPTNITDKPEVPFNGIYKVTSFHEMPQFGFTGKELDLILETAREEGRLGGDTVEVKAKPKPKWWSLLGK